MTSEQQAAYVIAMAAQCMAEVAGMQAENHAAAQEGRVLPFTKEDFERVPIHHGCHHNAVLAIFHGR